MLDLADYPGGVFIVDTEFCQPPGHRPAVGCMVVYNAVTGDYHRYTDADLRRMPTCPLPTGAGTLWVAYYASAEVNVFLSLGWTLPEHLIDGFAEFRARSNGMDLPAGAGLLGALTAFGLSTMAHGEKDGMRQLAMRGGPFTPEEMRALLDYCQSDVDGLWALFQRLLPFIDHDHALLRGAYMMAAGRIEWNGIPMDTPVLAAMREHWEPLRLALIREVDRDVGVFEGTRFSTARWLDWCQRHDIHWPHREPDKHAKMTGPTAVAQALGVAPPTARLLGPALDKDTFKMMAGRHPVIERVRQLRKTLSETKIAEVTYGPDGRCRTLLGAFGSKTGRNAPSTTTFPFGWPAWMRAAMRPDPGWGFAYLDYSSQEFGEGAVFSGDGNMIAAYESGDPYMAFAIFAGAAPTGATKASHGNVRKKFKNTTLGVQYSMGVVALAASVGCTVMEAQLLLDHHRRVFARYWQWNNAAVQSALIHGTITASFGWSMRVNPRTTTRTLANWPLQANASEMLRLAVIRTTALGVQIAAPVHDALLIHAPLDQLDHHVALTRSAMEWASRQVLGGYQLRVEDDIFTERFFDAERDGGMWKMVTGFLRQRGYRDKRP